MQSLGNSTRIAFYCVRLSIHTFIHVDTFDACRETFLKDPGITLVLCWNIKHNRNKFKKTQNKIIIIIISTSTTSTTSTTTTETGLNKLLMPALNFVIAKEIIQNLLINEFFVYFETLLTKKLHNCVCPLFIEINKERKKERNLTVNSSKNESWQMIQSFFVDRISDSCICKRYSSYCFLYGSPLGTQSILRNHSDWGGFSFHLSLSIFVSHFV